MSETTTETQTQQAPAIVGEDYEQSPALEKFAEALADAQGEIENADKSAANPHFKTNYADLASVINACREPLAKNKIARLQTPRTRANGDVGVRTALLHASGQFVAFTFWCKPQQAGPQALGSVLTYLRRYGLAAAVGIGQEDDDGNAGNGRGEPPRDWNKEPPQGQERQRQEDERAKPQQRAPQATKSGGGLDKPNATAAGTIGDPPDIEHAATLKKVRDCIGNELKMEAKDAKEMLQTLFGVDSTAKLSKPQAAVLLQLVFALAGSEAEYKAAKEKAMKEQPGLFAKGAA